MAIDWSLHAVASISTLATTCLCTLPLLYQQLGIFTHRHSYEPIGSLYQDEDGNATKESQQRYSVRIQKHLILFGSSAGTALAVTNAVQIIVGNRLADCTSIIGVIYPCLDALTWILLTILGIYTFLEPRCTYVFASVARLAPLVFLMAISISVVTLTKQQDGGFLDTQGGTGPGLAYGQVGAAILVFTASINIPRRPDVYNNEGKIIDQMRTTTLYSRYTYAWANGLLWKAKRERRLEETDISGMDAGRRAAVLKEGFQNVTYSKDWSLLIHLVRAHAPAYILQTVLTLFVSILTFSPQFFLYKILKVLEARDAGNDIGYAAWFWVGALGLNKLLDAGLSTFLYWLCFMALNIPIRSQLSAVIFCKTLLSKDVKGSQKVEESSTERVENDINPALKGDGDDSELKTLKQGKVNLLAIDTTRIADVASFSNIFTESIFGIIIGFSSLIVVIGWQSLLASLVVVILIIPINIKVSKSYADAQDKLMKIRDQKMAAVSEALQGIRQIKFSALEKQWEDRIFDVRQEELKILKRVFINDMFLIACWIANPVLLAVAALSVYAYINGTLLPSTAFTALAIFNELEFVLSVVPELTTELLDAIVSSKRIQDYLQSAEKIPHTAFSNKVAIHNASIAWAADSDESVEDKFVLRGVELEFPLRELSLISGKTGSGKSLLLAALLGEADILEGYVELPEPPNFKLRLDYKATSANWILPNAIAYVAQIPWLENANIRDNILFGLPYNESRYRKTIYACSLEQDFSMLIDGEYTEIGANGINLSGGQRWRVSFARALYSRAGILVLDDIFSAVDAHVGRHIFEEGLCGELATGRTRILVTHHMKLCLPMAKYTVILEDGTVAHAGFVEDLKTTGELTDILSSEESIGTEDMIEEELELTNIRRSRRQSQHSNHANHANQEVPKPTPMQFVQTEERERGSVKRGVYWSYIKASGGIPWWILVALAFSTHEAIILGRTWFLKTWTNSYETGATTVPSLTHFALHKVEKASQFIFLVMQERDIGFWIGVYTALGFLNCFVGAGRYYLVFAASLRASHTLFKDFTQIILRAPLRWFDTVPIGRVLNRFSKDFETIDSKIGNNIAYFTFNMLGLIGIIAAGTVLSKYMFLLAGVVLAVSVFYASYYLSGAREVKRLESNSRSPIFEFFGSALTGVATIRAFGKAEEYIEKMYERIDHYAACSFHVWLFTRWIGFRLSVLGSLFSMIVGVVVVSSPKTSASLAGFVLSFAMAFSINVIWSIRRYANVELDMNATERIVEYTKIETERQGGLVPPAHWPSEGRIEVRDLVVSYAPDLPPVLKGISFTVESRQRLGVVGRTGAGKSSLTLSLFQFIHASQGTIHIDGLDASIINLYDLRSRMAIIPQDPVLFSGTVRSNLDAFNEHTDAELREALERVHLVPFGPVSVQSASEATSGATTPQAKNSNPFTSLNSPISEGGLNLSQGQRQLLCLARAIVSRPKILVLDEATSAVDIHTEELIRKSMDEEFTDCTTIVIAHRLATVVSYDRILVLGEGRVVEFGKPWDLLQKDAGAFRSMIKESGEEEVLWEMAKEAARIEGRTPWSRGA